MERRRLAHLQIQEIGLSNIRMYHSKKIINGGLLETSICAFNDYSKTLYVALMKQDSNFSTLMVQKKAVFAWERLLFTWSMLKRPLKTNLQCLAS